MAYEEIKFKVMRQNDVIQKPSHVNRSIMNENVKNLIYWCGQFHKKGLAPSYTGGSYGNLSFRLNPRYNWFIITASGSSLAESTSLEHFVLVHDVDIMRKEISVSGSKDPSSESMLHHAIYKIRPNVQAVFHGHYGLISQNAERLEIPITSQEEPHGTKELVDKVSELLNIHPEETFFEMRNHGFISLGMDLWSTGSQTLEVLRSCSK